MPPLLTPPLLTPPLLTPPLPALLTPPPTPLLAPPTLPLPLAESELPPLLLTPLPPVPALGAAPAMTPLPEVPAPAGDESSLLQPPTRSRPLADAMTHAQMPKRGVGRQVVLRGFCILLRGESKRASSSTRRRGGPGDRRRANFAKDNQRGP
jgi:hypothetical protein